ncbi:MAG: LanC-like protein [Candidatus Eremiobacteraeota bacterium]|nr:LanC-like protein [Candidatus Eremiobacteraeota bacterium]
MSQIVAEASSAWKDVGWPAHPDEDLPEPSSILYLGASGVVLALDALRRAGYTCPFDVAAAAQHVFEALPAAHDEGWESTAYLMGDAGAALVAALFGHEDAADRLATLCEANLSTTADELCTGVPGTMLAAFAMAQNRHDERWGDLIQKSADALWSRWNVEVRGVDIWEQRGLYGFIDKRFLGAGHGFVGNVGALLVAEHFLDNERRGALKRRAIAATLAFAQRQGERVNWPVLADDSPADRLQWCHGAPGFVIALAGIPVGEYPDFDDLLLQAGETIWDAGPLVKGPSLCHGTSGNGFAFLALYRRTGEKRWLQRARRFAMHAIAQMGRERERFGLARYSLWTGDLGVALYLNACRTGDPRILTLNTW